jgi:hypothetical protein
MAGSSKPAFIVCSAQFPIPHYYDLDFLRLDLWRCADLDSRFFFGSLLRSREVVECRWLDFFLDDTPFSASWEEDFDFFRLLDRSASFVFLPLDRSAASWEEDFVFLLLDRSAASRDEDFGFLLLDRLPSWEEDFVFLLLDRDDFRRDDVLAGTISFSSTSTLTLTLPDFDLV